MQSGPCIRPVAWKGLGLRRARRLRARIEPRSVPLLEYCVVAAHINKLATSISKLAQAARQVRSERDTTLQPFFAALQPPE